MSDAATTADALAPWLQGGGLLAFAGAVWLQMREQGKFLRRIMVDTAIIKDRVGADTDDDGTSEPTIPIRIPSRRARTNPRGVRVRNPSDSEEPTDER